MARRAHDNYPTVDDLARAIVQVVAARFPASHIVEPTSGAGAFVRACRQAYPEADILATDIVPDYGPACIDAGASRFTCADATTADYSGADLVIGNPPFVVAAQIIRRIRETAPGAAVAFLLPVSFFGRTKERDAAFWDFVQLSYFAPIHPRPSFTGDGRTDRMEYGVFGFGPAWGDARLGPPVLFAAPLRSAPDCVTSSSNPAPTARTLEDEPMATKKTEYQNCAGVTCSDGSCVTCQVGTAERHHDELLAALKDLGAHVGDIATELTTTRKALLAREPYTQHTTVAEHVTKAKPEVKPEPKVEPPPPVKAAEPPPPAKVEPPPAPKEPVKLTLDAIRPHMQDWIKNNGREKFVEMLAKFGAQKLPDVKDADLPKFVEALGLKIG